MKKTMILFLAIVFTASLNSIASAQDVNIDAFYKHLGSKIKYPEQARQNDLQGKSQLLFTLKDGKLSNVKIQTELGGTCDVEVLNTVLAYQNLKSLKNGKYALMTSFILSGTTAPFKNKEEETPNEYTALKLSIVGFANAKQAVNDVNVQGYGNKSFKISYQGNGVVIRGNHGVNEPMVIVDSTEVSYVDMKTMDPKQIDAIQILKGDAAILSYGPNAINGVIIITTKKPENKVAPVKEQKKQN